jgi:hypothetical protein
MASGPSEEELGDVERAVLEAPPGSGHVEIRHVR